MTIPFSAERYGDAGRRLKLLVDAWAPPLDDKSSLGVENFLTHGEFEMAYEGLILSCIECGVRCGSERAVELFDLGLALGLDRESVLVPDFWERAQSYFAEEEGFFAALMDVRERAAERTRVDIGALVGANVLRVREALYVEGAFSSRIGAWMEFADRPTVSFGCRGDGDVFVRACPEPEWTSDPPCHAREIACVRGRIMSVQSTMDWEGEITIHCAEGVLVARNWGDHLVLLVDGVLVAE